MSIMNTRQYEFSHGKKPRGEGYWCVKIIASDGKGKYSRETRFRSCKYGELRKWAREVTPKHLTIVEIEVLP